MSAIVCVPSESKEFLHVPVTATASLSGYQVEMAVIPYGADPVSADWHAAAWDGINAKILVGPGSALELAEAIYGVWVRITTAEEKPVLYSGIVRIT